MDRKIEACLIFAILFANVVSASFAGWTISSDWEISPDWSIELTEVPADPEVPGDPEVPAAHVPYVPVFATDILASGSGFNIQGSVAFQHPAFTNSYYSSPDGFFFTVENIVSAINGTDGRLSMTRTGGTLSFLNSDLCQVQLYSDVEIKLSVSGADLTTTTLNKSWNSTFPEDQYISINWHLPMLLLHEQYWSWLVAIFAIVLLFVGVIMLAYAIKEHKANILDAEETMMGLYAICILVFGFAAALYWIYS